MINTLPESVVDMLSICLRPLEKFSKYLQLKS